MSGLQAVGPAHFRARFLDSQVPACLGLGGQAGEGRHVCTPRRIRGAPELASRTPGPCPHPGAPPGRRSRGWVCRLLCLETDLLSQLLHLRQTAG